MKNGRIDITLSGIRPSREHQYENYQVCSLVQALLGSISPNMVAISMRCIGEVVRVHFFLEAESPEDRSEIGEIAFELEALQFTDVPIETEISIVGADATLNDLNGRFVYLRKSN